MQSHGVAREVFYWLLAGLPLLTSVAARAVEEAKLSEGAAARKSAGAGARKAAATNRTKAVAADKHTAKPKPHRLSPRADPAGRSMPAIEQLEATILPAAGGSKTKIASLGASLSGHSLLAAVSGPSALRFGASMDSAIGPYPGQHVSGEAGRRFRRDPLTGIFGLHAAQAACGIFGNVTVTKLAPGGLGP